MAIYIAKYSSIIVPRYILEVLKELNVIVIFKYNIDNIMCLASK